MIAAMSQRYRLMAAMIRSIWSAIVDSRGGVAHGWTAVNSSGRVGAAFGWLAGTMLADMLEV
jgi:hypothetical protein